MAENERWGFYVSRGEPLVIALARSFLFAEKKIFHIPPDSYETKTPLYRSGRKKVL